MNAYIHVPFCAQRCAYCDFYTQTNLGLRARYLEALVQEMHLRRSELSPHQALQHVYIGGGTPSILTPSELERIIDQLDKCYGLGSAEELTIECNPDDLTPDYAKALKSIGFNRVSMGVQSFQRGDLTFLHRRHSVEQVYTAVDDLRSAGIDNLSLDLIYGLPGQTLESWSDNIRQALTLDVPHLSAYHLIYEEGTPLMRLRDAGQVQEVSEGDSLRFFETLIEELGRAGYEHYEISNFAKPGWYAQLNTGYWFGVPYLGLGPSAHSLVDGVRSHNVASIRAYADALAERRRACEVEVLTPEEVHHEYIMTRLRTQWGIELAPYVDRFGSDALEGLLGRAERHLHGGRLCLEGGRLRLTPKGIFTSDAIIVDLFD